MATASHHGSDILPVLKSLAARAVTALSLEHAGYKSVSDLRFCERLVWCGFICLVSSLMMKHTYTVLFIYPCLIYLFIYLLIDTYSVCGFIYIHLNLSMYLQPTILR